MVAPPIVDGSAPGPDPDDLAHFASELRPALLRLTRTIRNQRVDTSITLTHLATLMTIEANEPTSAGELATSERMQPPSMTKILATLEGKGLIDRERHPTDGRQMLITVTPAGHDLIARERQARDAWLCTALARLSGGELALLHDVRPVLERLARL